MIGYWKGGRRPLTTTGKDFLENFVFLTPRFKGLLWFLVIGIPLVLIMDVINPTYKYRFENHDYHLTVKYQLDGDKVTGEINYIWKDNDNTWYLESNFTGKIEGNRLIVDLEKNQYSSGGRHQEINKTIELYIQDSTISFMGVTAPKI